MKEMFRVLKKSFKENPSETIKEGLFIILVGVGIWASLWAFHIVTLPKI
tara:strand:- start:12 stop:158 length:147 start_codon:yes stop_codon:yes gene_type:complete